LPLHEVRRMHGERFTACPLMLVKNDEPVRARIWQRPQEHRVHEREDRRRGADADGERKDGHGREPWTPAQGPHRVGQVLLKALDGGATAGIATFVLTRFDGAHVPKRPCARVRGRHTRRDVVVDRSLRVVLKLLGELLLEAIAAEQRTKTQTKRSTPAHVRSYIGLTTREIAADRRSHCAVSNFRARRPSAVSV
jgi:hypothetical protein